MKIMCQGFADTRSDIMLVAMCFDFEFDWDSQSSGAAISTHSVAVLSEEGDRSAAVCCMQLPSCGLTQGWQTIEGCSRCFH